MDGYTPRSAGRVAVASHRVAGDLTSRWGDLSVSRIWQVGRGDASGRTDGRATGRAIDRAILYTHKPYTHRISKSDGTGSDDVAVAQAEPGHVIGG